MLKLIVERGGAPRSDLPTLVRLCDMLARDDGPTHAPGAAAAAPSQTASASRSANHVEAPSAPSMLDFLLSPAVCKAEGLDAASFPTLKLIARQLALDSGPADPKTGGETPPVPAPQQPPTGAEAAADAGSRDGAPLPMAIPLPIVPGVKDWGGTQTVTVAPPPLPTAVGLSSEVPRSSAHPSNPSHRRPPEEESSRVTEDRQGKADEALAVQLPPGRPRRPTLRPPSALPANDRAPGVNATPPRAAATSYVAGHLPRNIEAALQQRRRAPAEEWTTSAVTPTPTVHRAACSDRYMDRLYARGTDGAATSRPSRSSSVTSQDRSAAAAAAVAQMRFAHYAEVVAQLTQAPQPPHQRATDEQHARHLTHQTRVHSLPRGAGGSAGPARYVYDARMQQYVQMTRDSRAVRPASAAAPPAAPLPPRPQPVLPSLHVTGSHRARGQTPKPLGPREGGGLDLTIVGSRLDIPSTPPAAHATAAARPAGRRH